jgi:hypothetical protein
MTRTEQQIAVKGQAPVTVTLRQSPHGPIVNDVLGENAGKTPIAMWWAFLDTQNPILEGFYQLNRADTLAKARAAAAKVSAPGLNIVWANAKGDIGWWAAAQLPIRPAGVNAGFILDGSTALGAGHVDPLVVVPDLVGVGRVDLLGDEIEVIVLEHGQAPAECQVVPQERHRHQCVVIAIQLKTSGRLPPRTPSASPGTWPTALPPRFVPSHC